MPAHPCHGTRSPSGRAEPTAGGWVPRATPLSASPPELCRVMPRAARLLSTSQPIGRQWQAQLFSLGSCPWRGTEAWDGGHGHGRAGKAEELQRQTWRGTEAWEGGHGHVCLSRCCQSLPLPPEEGPLSSPMRPRACPLDWKFFRGLTGVQSVVEKQHSVTRGTETSRARTCLPTPCLSSPNDWWSRRARRGRRSRQAGLAAHRASTTVGS
jgi:hypothetical protein